MFSTAKSGPPGPAEDTARDQLADELMGHLQRGFRARRLGAEAQSAFLAAASLLHDARSKVERDELRYGTSNLSAYLAGVQEHRLLLARARKEYPEARAGLEAAVRNLDAEREVLEGKFAIVPEDGVTLSVKAARHLALRLIERLKSGAEIYRKDLAVPQPAVDSSKKKPGPQRKKIEDQLKQLSASLTEAIEVHARARAAAGQASDSMAAVESLEKQDFLEPQKPTAEEVGRYLGAIEVWCRKCIPAQRRAAEAVLTFRKHLVATSDALGKAALHLRKVAYLESREVDADVEGLVFGARIAVEVMRADTREWAAKADLWVGKQLDGSPPVLEQLADEQEICDDLELRIKNVGVAVANKRLARLKHDQLSREYVEKPPSLPHFRYLDRESDVEGMIAQSRDHLKKAGEVNSQLEQHRARVCIAWDAYEARLEKAREVAVALSKLAAAIERARLRQSISDELKVKLAVIKKLRQLHADLAPAAADTKGGVFCPAVDLR